MKTEITILALAAAVVLSPGVAAAEVNSFKDWTVVCDNLRTCEAVGFGIQDSDLSAVLRLSRGGAAGAPAKVEIDLQGDVDLEGKPPVLDVDGRTVLTASVKRWGDTGGFTVVLGEAQVGPLLGAARNGALLSIQAGDKAVGEVSLAGMVAALRYVDDQQERAGTVTALVAKGAAPAGGVPAPPPTPVLHAAAAIAQARLPSKPPAAVQALFRKAECDASSDWGGKPEVHRLSSDQVLWQVPCNGGAYNFDILFVVVDKAGRASLAPLDGVDDGLVTNGGYDPQTRILSSYNKGRGVGDCGDSSEWVWTGQAFELSKAATMPVCRGYGSDWPVVFRAEVR
jgi:hypothetical protein